MINKSIFKSYDIRGIYPNELNEEAAFAIGRAFVKQTGAKSVVVGRDTRLGGQALFIALAQGILAEGAKVFDIGQVPTECVYFAVGGKDFPAGIMITASHNPKEYNGLKMLVKNGKDIQIVRGKDLLEAVGQLVKTEIPAQEGEINKLNIWQDFITHVLSFTDLSEITPLKIVVDASNGVAGLAIEKMQEKLPVEIIQMNFQPDGNFPNHAPNPLEKGSADKISEAVKAEKADFGLIFDGDVDRIFLVDEAGKMVSADVVLLLLAKYFLQKNPGMAVAYNAICSKAVPTFVKQWGGVPIKTKVGFINVRQGLLDNNGIMGGELSAHYCFKDNYFMDSGMIALLTLLVIFSKDQRKVSEIVAELSPYFKSAESNFKVADKEKVLEKVKQEYADPSTSLGAGGKADFLDGITVEYKDWWFNVRPSNTEPVLRLTIEADTQEILAQKIKELTKVIA